MDYNLYINSSILVPRAETEELIINLLEDIKNEKIFLDLGAGSGAIGIVLLLKVKNSFVYFNEISESACKILKMNIDRYGLQDRCEIICDNFENIEKRVIKKVDMLVSNPPYIPFDEVYLLNDEAYYEPTNALFIKEPEKIYENIIKIFNGKKMYFEISPYISKKLSRFGRILKDINGKDRILVVENKINF